MHALTYVHLSVLFLAPRGVEIPAAILDNRNGNVTVEFIPTEVGKEDFLQVSV